MIHCIVAYESMLRTASEYGHTLDNVYGPYTLYNTGKLQPRGNALWQPYTSLQYSYFIY